MMLWKCCTQYASKFGRLSSATGLEKVRFHSNPRERQCQRMLKLPHNCNCVISHTSKVMLQILQARLQQNVNHELPVVQAGFRKGRGTRDKLPASSGSSKKQESSRKTSISALLTMPKPLTVWITVNCGKFWIPDHLTCLLRNLYAGQEATVRTGHGTTDWFQIGKAVCQGCILSPCLSNLYAEYIMRNPGLERRVQRRAALP